MSKTLRYTGYIALSLLFGFLSAVGQSDLLKSLSANLFEILITILVLYVTLSNLVYNQALILQKESSADISAAVNALKRDVLFMFIIIATDFVLLILFDIIPTEFWDRSESCFFLFNKQIAINTITFFSLFYYLYVIYDSSMAFFNLLKNSTRKSV